MISREEKLAELLAPRGVDDIGTYWEQLDQRRWSRYLRGIEISVVAEALDSIESPGDALEIGCDGGRWSSVLDSLGWQVTSVDIDARALEHCQMRVPRGRTVLADPDAETYPLESSRFDLLLCIQLPPATERWFVSEAARLLRPGGTMVFDVINSASYRSLLSRMRSTVRRDEVFYLHRFDDVRNAYMQHGFRFRKTVGHAWPPFSRDSDSRLIPMAGRLEQMSGLRRLSRYAPWVISIAELEKAQEHSDDEVDRDRDAPSGVQQHRPGAMTCES